VPPKPGGNEGARKVLAGGSPAVRSLNDRGWLSAAMAMPGAANANAPNTTKYLNMTPLPQLSALYSEHFVAIFAIGPRRLHGAKFAGSPAQL
jgi:hypothetical protein